jgi:hypothetical protein
MKAIYSAAALVMALSTSAFAWEGPMPLTDQATSEGCDVSVSYEEDTGRLLYEFNDHTAYTDFRNGRNFVQGKCKVNVPVHVPAGYRAAVGYVKLAYDYQVPHDGQGYTTLRFALKGTVEEGVARQFNPGRTDTDIIHYTPELKWSKCGQGLVDFELRSKIVAKAGQSEDALISYENGAGDLLSKYPSTKIICGVVYQRCQ